MKAIDDLYRPPQAPGERRTFQPLGASLKWIYGALALARATADLLGAPRVGLGIFFVAMLVGLSWLHQAWSDFPNEDRAMAGMGDIGPGGAVGRLFVPFYGIFWGFAVHARLNEAITASLHKRGIEKRAEPELAYVGMGLTMLTRLLSAVSPSAAMIIGVIAMVPWFGYMLRCDEFRRLMILAWHAEREGEAREGSSVESAS